MINFLLNFLKKDKNIRFQESNIFIDNKDILYKPIKIKNKLGRVFILHTYIYYNNDIKLDDSFIKLENQSFTNNCIYYKNTFDSYYFLFPYEFVFNINTIYKDHYINIFSNFQYLNEIKYNYLNELNSLNVNIYLHSIKNTLSDRYENITIDDNKLVIQNSIKTEKFLYGKKLMIYFLPKHLQDEILSVEFVINCNYEIIECFVITKTTSHPNINFRNNKYCLGNYRFKKLNEDNVLSIIENIKIYNLINYYHIPENLKDYIKTNLNNEFEDENFFN